MSTTFKTIALMSVGFLLSTSGCSTTPSEAVTPSRWVPESRSSAPDPEKADGMKERTPRTIASLRLTEKAWQLIESKRPDEALRTLERSLHIDPHNGRNYYYLAEAWMMKGNTMQAAEFNRMAGIYLNHDAVWMHKVQMQKERIENIRR